MSKSQYSVPCGRKQKPVHEANMSELKFPPLPPSNFEKFTIREDPGNSEEQLHGSENSELEYETEYLDDTNDTSIRRDGQTEDEENATIINPDLINRNDEENNSEADNRVILQELLSNEHEQAPNCCGICRLSSSLILRLVTEIAEDIKFQRTKENSSTVLYKRYFSNFPLSDRMSVEKFDRNLQNQSIRIAFLKDIKNLGGKSLQKGTSALLSYLMTDKVAKGSSWTGINEGLKIKDCQFTEIIVEILMEIYTATKDAVEAEIKKWFQRAGDRLKLAASKEQFQKRS